ncbi:MAG: GNAT family N-acetyltransferase [Clostridium sp.]|uniref:GNAT family N-acetyltransferase n=1 Tax=Clostridium sp. TaxID=1506 RepID=UPI003D6D9682
MIRDIEEMSLNAFPALQNMVYDGWVLRFADGYARRANSINPLYFSNENINQKIKNCEEIYNSRNLDVIYKITPNVYPSNLDSILEDLHYKIDAATSLQVLELDNISEPSNENIICNNDINEAWLNYFCEMDNISDKNKVILKSMLKNIIPQKYFILLQVEGKIIGCGLGVLDKGFIGIYDIVVDKDYRNKGYGRELVLNLLKLGKKDGAKKAYLQVMLNNPPALKVYSNIGFKEVYKYWYRVKSA